MAHVIMVQTRAQLVAHHLQIANLFIKASNLGLKAGADFGRSQRPRRQPPRKALNATKLSRRPRRWIGLIPLGCP
jgi:hypothetical protein